MRASLHLLAFVCLAVPALAERARPPAPAKRAVSARQPANAPPAAAPASSPELAPPTTPATTATPVVASQLTPTVTSLGFDTALYGELLMFEKPPENVLKWDLDSARLITFGPQGPVIHLKGKLATGHEMMFDDQWVMLANDHFDIAFPLSAEPRLVEIRVLDPERRFRIYPIVFFWNRALPKTNIVANRRLGFAQLYSNNDPTMLVDLDATREASLSFRLYLPPGIDTACERWDLIIENMAGREVAHLFRKGFPPPFVDWRVLRDRVSAPGEYHYRLQMTYGGQKFDSAPSRFHAFAGSHVFEHPYSAAFKFEPRQELGFFTYTNPLGLSYRAAYLGADLALSLRSRFLLKASGMTALPGSEPNGTMTMIRAGLGLRLAGWQPNTRLGNPFLFRLDAIVGFTTFQVGRPPLASHFDSPSGLLEATFVLRSRHRLMPWAEIGMRPSPADLFRLSAGVNYSYYLRSWAAAIGVGVGYDQLLQFASAPNLRFTLMRAMTSFTFFL